MKLTLILGGVAVLAVAGVVLLVGGPAPDIGQGAAGDPRAVAQASPEASERTGPVRDPFEQLVTEDENAGAGSEATTSGTTADVTTGPAVGTGTGTGTGGFVPPGATTPTTGPTVSATASPAPTASATPTSGASVGATQIVQRIGLVGVSSDASGVAVATVTVDDEPVEVRPGERVAPGLVLVSAQGRCAALTIDGRSAVLCAGDVIRR